MISKEEIVPGIVEVANQRRTRGPPVSNMSLVPGFATGASDPVDNDGLEPMLF